MNLIQNTILNSLPANKKKTPSGWISFNAPCCIHNGETQDKKKRGGIMAGADGTLSYHCFNCGYKASYVLGRKLTQKMRTFMGYIGIADDTIKKLAIEAMRHEEGDIKYEKKKFVSFHKKQMPKNTHSLDVWLEKYVAKDLTAPQYNKIDGLLNYLKVRGIDPTWYDFMYSPDMWVARWLMEKICDINGLAVSLDPKPVTGDWNGAGCHTNFSTKGMREEGGDDVIHKAIKKLKPLHQGHIDVYGSGNEKRLTGEHETCPITEFRWGVSDRGASVRVPWQVDKDGKGYLEDRRPSANCDPYLVAWRLIKTICGDD